MLDALVSGDLDAAEAALAQLPQPLPQDLLEPAAMIHLGRARWDEAAALFDRLASTEPASVTLRNYARNMAELRRRRPALHDLILATPDTGRYDLVTVAGGQGSIARIAPPQPPQCLTRGNDPARNLDHARAALAQLDGSFAPITLAGIGDGHVLSMLACTQPPSPFGQQQVVYVLEPDPELVRACLLLHDYAGPAGPIVQQRFAWCVGPQWDTALAERVEAEPQLPLSGQLLFHTLPDPEFNGRYAQIANGLDAADARTRVAVQAHYEGPELRELHRVFRGEAGRKPRVLILTSRFTTVLQYSARDTLAAFAELGWDTHLAIERADWLQLTARSVRREVADFKPDLVFVIDHLRREYSDLFPPQVPFACWIQDDLTNLTNGVAGASVGVRDFVLTCAGQVYNANFGYPLRQCIYVEKLTRTPQRPARWTSDGDDLVFVSNAARDPAAIAAGHVAVAGANQPVAELLRATCDAMIARYRDGGAFEVYGELRQLLRDIAATRGLTLSGGEQQHLASLLFNGLNNTLYRHQALRWVAGVAERHGLTLGLYGAGWDANPEFARYARGPVAYGPDLETLTRRGKINLQVVPFSCMHQRLLDGLVAGGFFLIRQHPIDQLYWGLGKFADEARALGVGGTAELRKLLTPARQAELDDVVTRWQRIDDLGGLDPIFGCLELVPQGIDFRYRELPCYADTTFRDQATLEQAVLKYIADPAARQAIAAEQRAFVEAHYTYVGGMRRVTARIATLLEEAS